MLPQNKTSQIRITWTYLSHEYPTITWRTRKSPRHTSYTEAEARTLEYLDELTPSPVTIKSLKPLGVNDTMGLDVDSTSAGYYIVSVVDEVDGKKVTRKTLVKELSIMEASDMASYGRIQDVADARVLDIVDIIKAA